MFVVIAFILAKMNQIYWDMEKERYKKLTEDIKRLRKHQASIDKTILTDTKEFTVNGQLKD